MTLIYLSKKAVLMAYSYAKQKRNLAIVYIVSRCNVTLLVTKLHYDMKSSIIPQLARFSQIPHFENIEEVS